MQALAVAVLAAVLFTAASRPQGPTVALVAVHGAALLVALGAVAPQVAIGEMTRLAPVVGFLAATLVIAKVCDDEGLFRAAGALLARIAGGHPHRLFAGVFVVASACTAVLSLDTTVVLLTPVILATAVSMGVARRPHAFAAAHLANTASLLLPVSNLTNLLAFAAAGVSFLQFTALMSAPWLAGIAVEFAVLRWLFRRNLAAAPGDAGAVRGADAPPVRVPAVVVAVLAATLVAFPVTSLFGVEPVWPATVGAAVLAVHAVVRRRSTPGQVLAAINPGFAAFVLALGVVVAAVMQGGLAEATARILPSGDGLPAMLGLAVLAALLANLVNNLPAVLVLLPLVASGGTAAVLAVLIGVNIGSNLTYVGSLANLLWRIALRRAGMDAGVARFSAIGALTVPPTLLAAVVALWAGLQVIGP